MDVIGLGCALAETRGFSGLMGVASALGHGAIVAGLARAALAAALLLPSGAMQRRRVLLVPAGGDAVNGWSAGRLVLARGWRDYVVTAPGTALHGSGGQVRFRFACAARPGAHDPRPLSVAFAALEARPRP